MTSYTEEHIKQKLIEQLDAVHVVSFFLVYALITWLSIAKSTIHFYLHNLSHKFLIK